MFLLNFVHHSVFFRLNFGRYLKNKLQEQEKARFHFFNSFFFRKLAGMDKNAPYTCDGKSAFQSVRKWTRKVNLFEKDYIFIPVNFK
jgi:sentrin-specific protease 7